MTPNEFRADTIASLFSIYTQKTEKEGGVTEDNVIDFFSDTLHFLADYGFDAQDIFRQATEHFNAETEAEPVMGDFNVEGDLAYADPSFNNSMLNVHIQRIKQSIEEDGEEVVMPKKDETFHNDSYNYWIDVNSIGESYSYPAQEDRDADFKLLTDYFAKIKEIA